MPITYELAKQPMFGMDEIDHLDLPLQEFPRSDNPFVSILIPTRGRSQALCEAIDSVYSLAKDKSLVEFVLKVDDDDRETIKTANRLTGMLGVSTIMSPRGKGYRDMHLWI